MIAKNKEKQRETERMIQLYREGTTLFDYLRTATNGRIDQLVRLFRGPLHTARLAEDLNVEPMLPTDGDR